MGLFKRGKIFSNIICGKKGQMMATEDVKWVRAIIWLAIAIVILFFLRTPLLEFFSKFYDGVRFGW